MDLTFTLADLTATSACELRLYTELQERAQKQTTRPAPEKSERAREAYRECLRALTEGGAVGGEHAGGKAHPVLLVVTSAAGLTYTVELDRLEYAVTNGAPADSTAEGNTARIICTPIWVRRRIGRCYAVPWRRTCWPPGSPRAPRTRCASTSTWTTALRDTALRSTVQSPDRRPRSTTPLFLNLTGLIRRVFCR